MSEDTISYGAAQFDGTMQFYKVKVHYASVKLILIFAVSADYYLEICHICQYDF